MDFSSIPIWIQVHNLPIEYMSKENVEDIGTLVGEVLEVDFTGNGGKYHSVKQSNLKEPFGFGPWMKVEAMNKRTTRWVEFLAEIDQINNEKKKKKKEEDICSWNLMCGENTRQELQVPRYANYNEEEKSGLANSSVWASKRKFDEEENTFNGRALKLTKVGSGLLKVQSQANLPHQPILKEISKRPRMDKKKRLKELAREQSVFASNSPLQEVTYIESVSLNINESLTSKMAEEESQHMPPTQPWLLYHGIVVAWLGLRQKEPSEP
ncbi:hypothetical protein SO802_028864 [Lithocarpus litseifolius]|uniref:DUF4283 domain-containing protein n=1 Tax=Lithocarpus litseifolius TaxID=425828 RepID=A0AAW2BRF5_9ROSI